MADCSSSPCKTLSLTHYINPLHMHVPLSQAIVTFEQAIQSYQECRESGAELPESVSNFIPFVLNEIGIAHARRGNLEAAVQSFDHALQVLCEIVRTTHQSVNETHAPDGTNATSVSIKSGELTIKTCDESGCRVSTIQVPSCAEAEVREFPQSTQPCGGEVQAPPGTPCNTMCLLMETKKHLAMTLKIGGAHDAAMALFTELLDAFSEKGMYANSILYSDVCFHLAALHNSRSEFEEAEPLIRKCIEIRRRIWGSREASDQPCEGKCSEFASEIAIALCLLGTTIASPSIGKYDEAEASVHEAKQIMEQWSQFSTQCGARELQQMDLLLESIRAAREAAEQQRIHEQAIAEGESQPVPQENEE